MKPKLPSGTLDRLWSDPKNWKAYCVYYCQEDPRYIVPKRSCKWMGWTINVAHPAAWLVLLLCIVYLTAPVIYLVRKGLVNTWIYYVTLAGLILTIITLCWVLASPQRYEEND